MRTWEEKSIKINRVEWGERKYKRRKGEQGEGEVQAEGMWLEEGKALLLPSVIFDSSTIFLMFV